MNEIFRLYANCFPVRGARRSLICDVQKGRGDFIPNGLYFVLTSFPGKSVEEIKLAYKREQDVVIDGYFDFLLKKGYGFLCDEPDRFPALDLSWHSPARVTNAIIDVDRNSHHDYRDIFSQLDELGCEAIQVRAYDALTNSDVKLIVKESSGRHLRHMELVLRYTPRLTFESLAHLCHESNWISRVIVHSSPYTKVRHVHPLPVVVVFQEAHFDAFSCGQVDPSLFVVNIDHYTEAQHFNTCLNRKISICADGTVRNCPSMKETLGNIRVTRLADVIDNPILLSAAKVRKDQVSVCRDCEFRYICTDCRAFTVDPKDPYSKPAKCGYDPYTATWHDQR